MHVILYYGTGLPVAYEDVRRWKILTPPNGIGDQIFQFEIGPDSLRQVLVPVAATSRVEFFDDEAAAELDKLAQSESASPAEADVVTVAPAE